MRTRAQKERVSEITCSLFCRLRRSIPFGKRVLDAVELRRHPQEALEKVIFRYSSGNARACPRAGSMQLISAKKSGENDFEKVAFCTYTGLLSQALEFLHFLVRPCMLVPCCFTARYDRFAFNL